MPSIPTTSDDVAFARLTNRSRWVGRVWGALLLLFSLVSFTLRSAVNRDPHALSDFRDANPLMAAAMVAIAIASIGPSILGGFLLGLDFRRSKYFLAASFIMCISIPLSLLTVEDITQLVHIVVVYNLIACLAVSISSNADIDALSSSLFSTIAITQGFMLAWVLEDRDYTYGRLWGRVQPNYWGMVAQLTVVSSIALRGWFLRVIIIVISCAILYETQSRGSEVALAVGLAFAFALFTARSRWRAPLWLGAGLVVVFALLLGSDFIANGLLMANDPARGAGSGFTGRSSAWREAFDLGASHPWTGVGFRQHEHYLTTASSAHNAYLATFADTGIIGLLGYLLFLIGGFVRATLKAVSNPSGPTLASAAFMLAFLVNGMFERMALNTGNAYCVLMLIVAALAWRQDEPNVTSNAYSPPSRAVGVVPSLR